MSEEPVINVVFDRPGLTSSRQSLDVYTRKVMNVWLNELGCPRAEVTVLFCSRAAIARLKEQFLGDAHPTDVLSFPALDRPAAARKRKGAFYLGDIALCLPVCAQQAREQKRKLAEETTLLLAHGLLHLVGMDHDTPTRKRRMWQQTDRLLQTVTHIRPPRMTVEKGRR